MTAIQFFPLVALALVLKPSLLVPTTPPSPTQTPPVGLTSQAPYAMPAMQGPPASVPASKTTTEQTAKPAASPVSATPNEATPRETFSQLTLFLFGSGLALFVALLGWSDQIRGINSDTKNLATTFVEKTKISRKHFLSAVKPASPDEQLIALTALMVSKKLTTVPNVELLSKFKQWNEQWGKLESLSSRKYDLTMALTMSLFLAGVASLFTNASSRFHIRNLSARVEVLLLIVPLLIVAALICILILASRQERLFKELLNEIEDKV
jgi:hypothetical protein